MINFTDTDKVDYTFDNTHSMYHVLLECEADDKIQHLWNDLGDIFAEWARYFVNDSYEPARAMSAAHAAEHCWQKAHGLTP